MEIIVMWWQWWTQRNKVRDGEKPLDAKLFTFRVACTAAEYQESFYKATTSRPCSTSRWTTPPPDFLKFNVDGAYTPGNQHGAWGVVVRNSEGTLVAARAGRVEYVADAFGTELCAVEKAIDLAAELGVVRLMIETDALLVEQALNRRAPNFSKEAQVIEDIKVQINLWFSSCKFVHCKREANMPAHHLAKLGLSLHVGEVLVFDENVLACIADSVLGDLAQAVA